MAACFCPQQAEGRVLMAFWVVGVLFLRSVADCMGESGWAEDLGMDMCPEKELSPSYLAKMQETVHSECGSDCEATHEMKQLMEKQQMQLEQLEGLVAALQDTVLQLRSAMAATEFQINHRLRKELSSQGLENSG